MPKGVPNNKYTGKFKQMVIETMRNEEQVFTADTLTAQLIENREY